MRTPFGRIAIACALLLPIAPALAGEGTTEVGVGTFSCRWMIDKLNVARSAGQTDISKDFVTGWFQGFASGVNIGRHTAGNDEYFDIEAGPDELFAQLLAECRKTPSERVGVAGWHVILQTLHRRND